MTRVMSHTDDDRSSVDVLRLIKTLVVGEGVDGNVGLLASLEIRETLPAFYERQHEPPVPFTCLREQIHVNGIRMVEIQLISERKLDAFLVVLAVEAVLDEVTECQPHTM